MVSLWGEPIVAGVGNFADQMMGTEQAQESCASSGDFSALLIILLLVRPQSLAEVSVAETLQLEAGIEQHRKDGGIFRSDGTQRTIRSSLMDLALADRIERLRHGLGQGDHGQGFQVTGVGGTADRGDGRHIHDPLA